MESGEHNWVDEKELFLTEKQIEVDARYLQKFKVENVGGEIHNELWVPSEELEEFNKYIVRKNEVITKHS